jgi:hypothetical protein
MARSSTIARQGDRRGSWMMPGAKGIKRLLYLSEDADTVYVYNYRNGKQVGELTGLGRTEGECVDAKGDVYITNFANGYVVEYAHGGTKQLALYHTRGSAVGCAVDSNNDLAATNLWTYSSSSPGGICLWKHGKGEPSCYRGGGPCFYAYPPGYDNEGNVIFEGQGEVATGVCAVLSGTSKITTLAFSGSSCCGGGVTWDGKYIDITELAVVGSGIRTTIAQTTLSGTTLTAQSETALYDTCGADGSVEVATPSIVGVKNTPINDEQGKVLIGGDLATGCSRLAFWHYPSGADPYRSVGSFAPVGAVVSIAPSN